MLSLPKIPHLEALVQPFLSGQIKHSIQVLTTFCAMPIIPVECTSFVVVDLSGLRDSMSIHSLISIRTLLLKVLNRVPILKTLYFFSFTFLINLCSSLVDTSVGVIVLLSIPRNYIHLLAIFRASSRVGSHSMMNFSPRPLCLTQVVKETKATSSLRSSTKNFSCLNLSTYLITLGLSAPMSSISQLTLWSFCLQ